MTSEPAEPLRLDYLIKAGAIHSMTGETYRSVGVRGPEIVALSAEPDGLDDLAGSHPAPRRRPLVLRARARRGVSDPIAASRRVP